MRRLVLALAATAAGLVALLDYKSGSPVSRSTASSVGSVGSVGSAGSAGSSSSSAKTTTTVPPTGSASAGSSTTGSSTTGSSSTTAQKTATGEDVTYRYGDIEVAVTVSGDRITTITTPDNDSPDFRSAQINSEAVPTLTSEAIAAQGASIDAVSGATYTSDAFIDSLQSALHKLGR
jgi:uncharacterized protein with FMN-binding domain